MPTNGRASKSKGYKGEVEFVEACTENGHAGVERNGNRYGSKDRGDAAGVADWTIQIKSVERISIPEWLRDVEKQAVNNGGTRWRGIALKLRGKHMRDGVMILPMGKWFELVAYVNELEGESLLRKRLLRALESVAPAAARLIDNSTADADGQATNS